MSWQDRIVIDPEVLVGKPIVKGTRLAVEFIIDLLPQAWSEQQILDNYPMLTREDILARLAYASVQLHRPDYGPSEDHSGCCSAARAFGKSALILLSHCTEVWSKAKTQAAKWSAGGGGNRWATPC
jgi:uncharacterized protein (DUF433 family)